MHKAQKLPKNLRSSVAGTVPAPNRGLWWSDLLFKYYKTLSISSELSCGSNVSDGTRIELRTDLKWASKCCCTAVGTVAAQLEPMTSADVSSDLAARSEPMTSGGVHYISKELMTLAEVCSGSLAGRIQTKWVESLSGLIT